MCQFSSLWYTWLWYSFFPINQRGFWYFHFLRNIFLRHSSIYSGCRKAYLKLCHFFSLLLSPRIADRTAVKLYSSLSSFIILYSNTINVAESIICTTSNTIPNIFNIYFTSWYIIFILTMSRSKGIISSRGEISLPYFLIK